MTWLPRLSNILQVLFELPCPILSQKTERVPTVCVKQTVRLSRQSGKLLNNFSKASSCQSIGLQLMLSSTYVFFYMMPSKPLAAKASVFKLPKHLSSTATLYMMSCRQSLRNQTSPFGRVSFFQMWSAIMISASMTAQSNLRWQNEICICLLSICCDFAPVKSILIAKVSIGELQLERGTLIGWSRDRCCLFKAVSNPGHDPVSPVVGCAIEPPWQLNQKCSDSK